MNKANVFLLVVVSSLLTYISIDRSPVEAAAADDVWESWEFREISADTTNEEYFNSVLNSERDLLLSHGLAGWQLFQVDDYGSANTRFWFRRIRPGP